MNIEFVKLMLHFVELFFTLYLIGYSTFLFLSVCMGTSILYRDMKIKKLKDKVNKNINIPISILVPAHNEEITVCDTIKSLLELDYNNYEIIIIDDGSIDNTAKNVIDCFGMSLVSKEIDNVLKTSEIKKVYETYDYKVNITLVIKENGGKADALNVGINFSSNPYFICMDADSFLQKDSLINIVRPILEDDLTVAVGGMVRVSNDLTFADGYPTSCNLPKNFLVAMQVLEYDRTFLGSRIMFDKFNGNLIISGAFGLFQKEMVIAAGGYDTDTMGEDMELVVKLHVFCRTNLIPYRIKYASDAICWSQAPSNLKDLTNQRRRWYLGLFQSMTKHHQLFLNYRYGLVSFISYLYFLIYELFSPFIELIGIIFMILSFFVKLINIKYMIFFYLLYALFGALLSVTSFFARIYVKNMKVSFIDSTKVLILCFLEITVLRLYLSVVRMFSFFKYKKRKNNWGEIKRYKIENS